MDEVLAELATKASTCGYPVYASMDVRDAGWKTCVVDVNLFPAGFNILKPSDRERGAQRMREFWSAKLLKIGPWKIAVVPEAHTNNQGYLENLSGILGLLRDAGCEPRLVWAGEPAIPKPWKLKTRSGAELEYLPPAMALDGADAVLLNHDLSGGIPKAIEGVALPIFPSTKLGWYRRRKTTHQEIVESLLQFLARRLPFFDPWYFMPRSEKLILGPEMDLSTDAGIEALAGKVDALLTTLTQEYKERGIEEKPHVFLKNDAGTYGLGVVSVQSASEIREKSKWIQEKFRKGKEAVPVSQLILQEGVPTALHYLADPAKSGSTVVGEPVLYLVNGIPIGGFLRVQEQLGDEGRFANLNQPGSKLEALDCLGTGPERRPFPRLRGLDPCDQLSNRHVYGFLARLHATAAGLEECPG
jgi:glutamate--cysteine ligase